MPWLTCELINNKRQKEYLKQKAKLSKSEDDWSAYKSLKKSYNRLIKSTIRQHYQDKLQSNSGDLKKTWKTINELIHKSNKHSRIPLIDSNKEVIDPTNVPNQFNKYFTELGGKLSNDIPPSTSTPDRCFASFECPRNTLSYFKEVSEIEVFR